MFPRTGNYSNSLLFKSSDDKLYISHKAPGADLFRYSTNWGSSWSNWQAYTGANTTVQPLEWLGTKEQEWTGEHVAVQYWGQMIGSSDHVQQGDLAGTNAIPRRYPHFFIHGAFNQYGYDSGLPSTMEQDKDGIWQFGFMDEWPSEFQANVWGTDENGQPDQTRAFGDVDNDTVLEMLSPVSLLANVVNITTFPESPYLAWRIFINDGDLRYYKIPFGSRAVQIIIFCLLASIPIITGIIGILTYLNVFYAVKFNEAGIRERHDILPLVVQQKLKLHRWVPDQVLNRLHLVDSTTAEALPNELVAMNRPSPVGITAATPRRTVLIATMEYDIEDWDIKIKIGGLGVMAQLMGKNLGHQNLIWVVPCVGGIDYPIDERAEPMSITVLGSTYTIQVQYHVLRNITYVLLDAPVFRQQTKAEPYPPRMDDIDSAIYYSAWNSCIAEAMKRFPIDLYHINDYHGTVAPLHLLPKIIPCCLSLHNAEFQGLWPMRNAIEMDEVCRVYNLDQDIVRKYVQFGEVFNLLHAGASYLRIHQKGFGAVGVSTKYGKRSFARYPIFWGLTKIGALPNPDPTDTADWDKQLPLPKLKDVVVDPEFEAGRGNLKRQAQEWAGLDTDPTADLFVFVGRWSMQKGVDLIADVFPDILEKHPKSQLICIGPVIDLYGKFAALKLGKMMELYPGRVYSKPEFTALPSYIFSGAEFALIPSRDEPFGLVAVEFGRKGALGVGSRVGGLGQMPGWWFTVESTTTKHLVRQLKMAIETALHSKIETRARMRAQSAKQRFPVAQWKEDLGILQDTATRLSQKQAQRASSRFSGMSTPTNASGDTTPTRFWYRTGISSVPITAPPSRPYTRASSPVRPEQQSEFENIRPSLGKIFGPGHTHTQERTGRQRQRLRISSRNSSMNARQDGPSRPSSVTRRIKSHMLNTNSTAPTISEDTDVPPSSKQQDNSSRGSSNADPNEISDEYFLTQEQAENGRRASQLASLDQFLLSRPMPRVGDDLRSGIISPSGAPLRDLPPLPNTPGPGTPGPYERRHLPMSPLSGSGTPAVQDMLISPSSSSWALPSVDRTSAPDPHLSLTGVLQGKTDYKLQNVEPFFTDPTQQYFQAFKKKLEKLDGKTSEGSLCIEEYLVKSEKEWFHRFHDAKMGKSISSSSSSAPSVFKMKMFSRPGSIAEAAVSIDESDDGKDQFLLRKDYSPPTGIRKFLMTKIRDWPIYTFLLALVGGHCLRIAPCFMIANENRRVKLSQPTRIRLHCLLVKLGNQRPNSMLSPPYTSLLLFSGGSCSAPSRANGFLLSRLASTVLLSSCSAWLLTPRL